MKLIKALFTILLVIQSALVCAQDARATVAADNQPEDTEAYSLAPFSIKYRSKYKAGWFSFNVGANRTLKQISDHVWQLSFNAKASMAGVKETSVFSFIQGKIVPIDYDYKASGLIEEDDRDLNFLSDTKIIRNNRTGQDIKGQWRDGLQDNLTYIMQASLFLAQGQEEFTIPVFEKKKTKNLTFRVIGKESIKLPAGTYETIKVQQLRKDKKREIHAWFAIQEGYPLIKLRDKKDGKERYRIEATKVSG